MTKFHGIKYIILALLLSATIEGHKDQYDAESKYQEKQDALEKKKADQRKEEDDKRFKREEKKRKLKKRTKRY